VLSRECSQAPESSGPFIPGWADVSDLAVAGRHRAEVVTGLFQRLTDDEFARLAGGGTEPFEPGVEHRLASDGPGEVGAAPLGAGRRVQRDLAAALGLVLDQGDAAQGGQVVDGVADDVGVEVCWSLAGPGDHPELVQAAVDLDSGAANCWSRRLMIAAWAATTHCCFVRGPGPPKPWVSPGCFISFLAQRLI
jgi:hypothetical protein